MGHDDLENNSHHNRRDRNVPFVGPQISAVVCERTTHRKTQRSLWSDDLEPDSYRSMSKSSAPFIGTPLSSVVCKGRTNHNVHGHSGYDDPTPGHSVVFNTNGATRRGQLWYSHREPYARIRQDIQGRVDYRPLPQVPSGSRAQERYRDYAPCKEDPPPLL